MTVKHHRIQPRSIQLFLLGFAFIGVVIFFFSGEKPSADILSPLSQSGTIRIIVANEVGTTLQDGVAVQASTDTGAKKVTKENGYYVITGRDGTYTVTVSANNYESQSRTVHLVSETTTDATFYLKHR